MHALLAMIINCAHSGNMQRSALFTLPVAGVLAATALTSCATDEAAADDTALEINAAFYPLAFAAEQVGGERVDVTDLTPAGGDPHDLELSPQDLVTLADGDHNIYLTGMQPELDAAISEHVPDDSLDVADYVDMVRLGDDTVVIEEDDDDHDHDHDDDHAEEDESTDDDHSHDHDVDPDSIDPHVWLDPLRYIDIAEAIADLYTDLDPEGAEEYQSNLDDFSERLNTLHEEFETQLAERASDDIVTSHAAFGYLAGRYDLNQVAIAGLSTATEPTSGRMATVADFVNDNDVTTIFYETLVSPNIAETIAAETGAETDVLDPLEGLTSEDSDADYFTVMEDNLDALTRAVG